MLSKSRSPKPWWGSGPAPDVEYPGTSITIPAVWKPTSRRWESPDGRYYFDRAAAERAVDVGPTFFQHHIGAFAGQPFTLLRNHAQLVVRPLFGWRRASDHLRRFRKVVYFAPKGAGKSPLLALIGLTVLFFDDEAAAEVFAIAADRSQARIVHDDSKTMVEDAPELLARCEVLKDSIYVPASRSVFRVLSADSVTAHGMRPHCVLIDEIQLQRNRDLVEVAVRSMAKRRQPILLMAGHAGVDTESVGFEEFAYARGVIDGTLTDDALLPVIFAAADTDDWQDEDLWRRVNPSLGTTIQLDGLRQEAVEAKNEPRRLNDFKRFHLDLWTNQATSWLPPEWWHDSEEPTLESSTLAGYDCTAGLDMAASIDYVAFVVTVKIPLPADETTRTSIVDETGTTSTASLDYAIAVFPFYWLPADMLRDREKTDGLPLSLYRDRGLLFQSPGAAISADQVYRDIVTTIAPQFPRLRTIGFDPAFAADISQRLSVQFTALEIPQNYNYMTAPCYLLEGLLKSGHVAHAGHPILRWNIGHVEIKRDEAGRLRPVKPKTAGGYRKRIDGVSALLTSLAVLTRQAPVVEPSYQVLVLGR